MNTKGFTLIELLVVVLIIGILTSMALPQYQKSVIRARFAQVKVMADALYKADQVYFENYKAHNTTDFDLYDIDVKKIASSCWEGGCSFDWGYCYINSESFIQCELYQNGKQLLGYRIIRTGSSEGKRYCRAYAEGVYNKICAAETGTASPDSSKLYLYKI